MPTSRGKMALDGVLAHVGGGGRGSFNYRFAQPSRDAQPMSSIDWPTDIFPFTDVPETRSGASCRIRQAGLLDRRSKSMLLPKIFFSHTSYEYWGRAAALIHTTADGKADAAIGPNVRIYFYSGFSTFRWRFRRRRGRGRSSQQLPSPLPIKWFWRAMIANMDAWVREQRGASGEPLSEDRRWHAGASGEAGASRGAGLNRPRSNAEGWDLDFGPDWRGGILSQQPPRRSMPILRLCRRWMRTETSWRDAAA